MNRRTFEILGKWAGEQCGVKIVFDPLCQVPSADIKTNTLKFPPNIKKDEAYGALSTLLHEAGHIRLTTKLPIKKLVKNALEKDILNAIEDCRVDTSNFKLLPNIRGFYDRFLREHVKKWPKGEDLKKIPLVNRVLANCILEYEGFKKYKSQDREALDFDAKHDVQGIVADAVRDLERGNWDDVRKAIAEIIKLFKLKPPPDFPKDSEEGGEGDGKGKPVPGKGKPIEGQGKGKRIYVAGNASALLHPGKEIFSQGQGDEDCTGSGILTPVAVRDATRTKFKELLNIKVQKKIQDGTDLNPENIAAFLTGDVDELFDEESIERRKKSKIQFIIDASGSMETPLLDGHRRKRVVAGCVKELVTVLEEVRMLEGINVDYEVGCFNCDYHRLDKERWEKQFFNISGGTSLVDGFKGGQDSLLKDIEADGKKIIIMFTDGGVCDDEIRQVKRDIMRHNEDVRCLVMGVGADVPGRLVDDVVGDNNILNKEMADVVLMDAIMSCLD